MNQALYDVFTPTSLLLPFPTAFTSKFSGLIINIVDVIISIIHTKIVNISFLTIKPPHLYKYRLFINIPIGKLEC